MGPVMAEARGGGIQMRGFFTMLPIWSIEVPSPWLTSPPQLFSRKEISDWYDNLIEMMRKEEVTKSGHVQVVKNMVNELTELHFHLLHNVQDMKYKQLFMMAANNLLDYRRKTNLPEEVSDVELALHALYGHLMLRLQKKEINSQTTMAMETFSRMLAYLALRYKEVEENEEMM